MRPVAQRTEYFRSRALLDLANGQACANCFRQDGTTVSAHSNLGAHGKGKSIKAHDCFHAHLCSTCHSWLDQGQSMDPTGIYNSSRADKELMYRRAADRTLLELWRQGLIRVAK